MSCHIDETWECEDGELDITMRGAVIATVYSSDAFPCLDDPEERAHLDEVEGPETARRIVSCLNACRGLTPEQVAAVPRLIAWFTQPMSGDPDLDLHKELAAIFPTREEVPGA
jgi:hypothetical protein